MKKGFIASAFFIFISFSPTSLIAHELRGTSLPTQSIELPRYRTDHPVFVGLASIPAFTILYEEKSTYRTQASTASAQIGPFIIAGRVKIVSPWRLVQLIRTEYPEMSAQHLCHQICPPARARSPSLAA